MRGIELQDRRIAASCTTSSATSSKAAAGRRRSRSSTRDPARKEIGGVGGLVPGRSYELFEEGVARKIPAGADIVLQMHYTTIGQAGHGQTEVGVILAKEPPSKLRAGGGGQMPNTDVRDSAGRSELRGDREDRRDPEGHVPDVALSAHARARQGRRTTRSIYPDGKEEVLLRVPKYNFNWQTSYKLAKPKFMPKGSTLMVVAHYDNSSANRFNPDPTAAVRWGDQTWEEMLIGYYGTIEPNDGRASTARRNRDRSASSSTRTRRHDGAPLVLSVVSACLRVSASSSVDVLRSSIAAASLAAFVVGLAAPRPRSRRTASTVFTDHCASCHAGRPIRAFRRSRRCGSGRLKRSSTR